MKTCYSLELGIYLCAVPHLPTLHSIWMVRDMLNFNLFCVVIWNNEPDCRVVSGPSYLKTFFFIKSLVFSWIHVIFLPVLGNLWSWVNGSSKDFPVLLYIHIFFLWPSVPYLECCICMCVKPLVMNSLINVILESCTDITEYWQNYSKLH